MRGALADDPTGGRVALLDGDRVPGEPSGPPPRSLPSWKVLASPDKAAGTDVVRSMAERAGATITEVEGSHVIMISRPDVVADVIKTAAAAVGRPVAATADRRA